MNLGLLNVESAGEIHVVSLLGEHDLSTAPQLVEQIEGCFAAGSRIVVDLSQAEFVDSSILAALVNANRHAESTEDDALAVVVAADSPPARLFDMAGVSKGLATYPTREAALEALTDQPD